ncbi:MAG TPA: hypothetical protein VFO97_07055 [Desertimonas sp.]|nr:hypothetical protein [Desertimonas sp.]
MDAVLAFDFETAKNTSLWTVSVAVLLALLAVWLVKEVVKKVFTVVILLAIAGLAWSQRAELTACADEFQETVDAAAIPDTTCTFFGQEVTVPGRATLLTPAGATTTTTTPVG